LATERHEERRYVLLLPCCVRVVGLLTEGLAITNERERQKGGSGKDESLSFLGTANRTSRLRSPVEPWGGFTMAARRMCAEWSDGKESCSAPTRNGQRWEQRLAGNLVGRKEIFRVDGG